MNQKYSKEDIEFFKEGASIFEGDFFEKIDEGDQDNVITLLNKSIQAKKDSIVENAV